MDNPGQELDRMALDTIQESVAIESHLSFIESLLQRHEWDEQNRSAIVQSVSKARNREQDPQLYLGVVGEFNSGKSTLINALIRENLLKTDIVQGTTAAATLMRYAEKPDVVVRYKDKSIQSFQKNNLGFWRKLLYRLGGSWFQKKQQQMLAGFLQAATAQETISKDVEDVTLYYPAKFFQQGVVLIDTPGLNSLNERHTQVTEQVVRERCDACIVVIPSNNPLSRTLLSFLQNNLGDILHRCIFVVTKMDLTPREIEQEMLLKNIEARLRSELNLERPVMIAVAPKKIVDELNRKKTKIKQNPGTQPDQYVERFCLAEEKLARITQSNKFLIQIERVCSLLTSVLKGLEEHLGRLEEKYRLRHEALMKNRITDLGEFINAQKNIHYEQIQTGIALIKDEAADYVASIRDEILESLHDAINDCDSKSELKDVAKNKPEILLKEASRTLNQQISALFPEILKVGEAELTEFEKRFKELYKSLATLGGTIPFNQEDYQSNITSSLGGFTNLCGGISDTVREDEGKSVMRTLGGAGTGALIGSIFCPGLGTVIGTLLGWLAGVLFGPSLGELKDKYWNELRQKLSPSFDDTEYRIIDALDDAESELCRRLGLVIDRYFEKYDQLVKEMIARDRAEAAELERKRNLIREDLTRIGQHQGQLNKSREELRTII